MITGYEGEAAAVEAKRVAVTAVLEGLGGTPLGTDPGEAWAHGRFDAPYLRDSMLDVGVLVETMETATWWSEPRPRSTPTSGPRSPARSATARWCCATSPTSTRPAARSTSPSPPRPPRTPPPPWRSGCGQGRRQRRDGGRRRHDHPPPRRRHRPQAVADPRDRRARRLGAARGQGRPRPDRRPQPGGAGARDRPLVHLPGQPRLAAAARHPAPSSPSPGCCATPAPPSTSPTHPAPGRWRPWSTPPSSAATSWSRSAATACSPRWPAPTRSPAARSPCCPPAAATTSPGCSACPRTPRARPRCCSRAPYAASTCVSWTPAGAEPRPRRRLGLLRHRRPRQRDRRPGAPAAQGAAVPVRRHPRHRRLQARALPRVRRRRGREYAAPTSWSPTRPTTARA